MLWGQFEGWEALTSRHSMKNLKPLKVVLSCMALPSVLLKVVTSIWLPPDYLPAVIAAIGN